jgi:hypothetical protein
MPGNYHAHYRLSDLVFPESARSISVTLFFRSLGRPPEGEEGMAGPSGRGAAAAGGGRGACDWTGLVDEPDGEEVASRWSNAFNAIAL